MDTTQGGNWSMSKMVTWLQIHENRMFHWVNCKIQHGILDFVLTKLTHLGGATATIAITLGIALFAEGPWKLAGLQGLIALAISHIPVAIIKKKYPRLRPYLVIPQTNICKKPLTDHSFPSGHTTAIFAVIIPFVLIQPWIGLLLLIVAAVVGLSRIYLGLHYPSDCLVGGILGTMTACGTMLFFI
jgi:undecaprenyl-diphosphatase